MGIVIGSTFKGVIVGLIAGFFARKVSSVPLGIAVGLLAGLGFAYLIASQPDRRRASTTTGRSCSRAAWRERSWAS